MNYLFCEIRKFYFRSDVELMMAHIFDQCVLYDATYSGTDKQRQRKWVKIDTTKEIPYCMLCGTV